MWAAMTDAAGARAARASGDARDVVRPTTMALARRRRRLDEILPGHRRQDLEAEPAPPVELVRTAEHEWDDRGARPQREVRELADPNGRPCRAGGRAGLGEEAEDGARVSAATRCAEVASTAAGAAGQIGMTPPTRRDQPAPPTRAKDGRSSPTNAVSVRSAVVSEHEGSTQVRSGSPPTRPSSRTAVVARRQVPVDDLGRNEQATTDGAGARSGRRGRARRPRGWRADEPDGTMASVSHPGRCGPS